MSWMIQGTEQLKRDSYVEVLPGDYASKCWNTKSVYFRTKCFVLFERTLDRRTVYNHYSVNDIDRQAWEQILDDLQLLVEKIDGGCSLSTIEYTTGIVEEYLKSKACDSEQEFIDQVYDTFSDFIAWARTELERHDILTVIGQ